GDELISFGRKHEFADVSWYPSQQKALYRIDDRVLVNTSGNGLYDFTAFRSTLSLACISGCQIYRELQEATRDANGKCIGAKLINATLAGSGYGLTNNEDAVDFDITYYRSKDPLTPRLFEDIIEEIEQIGLFKYGGLPHWGKNRNIGFVGAINKYNKADKFLKVKDEYDPRGLFSNEWTNQVLGLKEGVSILKDGPGKIYKEARVCRRDVKTKEENDTKDEL
ncbi:L-gulono-1,4-lactone dehydrogenase-like protein, partial [Trifolium pratense]